MDSGHPVCRHYKYKFCNPKLSTKHNYTKLYSKVIYLDNGVQKHANEGILSGRINDCHSVLYQYLKSVLRIQHHPVYKH